MTRSLLAAVLAALRADADPDGLVVYRSMRHAASRLRMGQSELGQLIAVLRDAGKLVHVEDARGFVVKLTPTPAGR